FGYFNQFIFTFFNSVSIFFSIFFVQAEDGIRDRNVTGVQTCALPISKPLLGLTCASKPIGNSINNPVFMMVLSIGFKVISSSKLALKSIPAEAEVEYFGKSCFDLLMIFICIFIVIF